MIFFSVLNRLFKPGLVDPEEEKKNKKIRLSFSDFSLTSLNGLGAKNDLEQFRRYKAIEGGGGDRKNEGRKVDNIEATIRPHLQHNQLVSAEFLDAISGWVCPLCCVLAHTV